MPQSARSWLSTFLQARDLEQPDGRALYAYRCSEDEFLSLTELLKESALESLHFSRPLVQAFVLYAAEWWQRKYDGGRWAWEPLLGSIGCRGLHYPDLYEPVREAWRYWRVDLVRLPSSIRYLGTFACQGGLPIALVGDANSSIARYLRAVLRHSNTYRQFVDDPIELARDQQHLLRPPTLRRDYVFRLASDLVTAVIDLRADAPKENMLKGLDLARPGWRDKMPLVLEDIRARDLLKGLLLEAKQASAAPEGKFRVERYLRNTSVGWRLGARIELPARISAENLARLLKTPVETLRERLQVRTGSGTSVRVVGLYSGTLELGFRLNPNSSGELELWDAEAAGEIRLEFHAGGRIGEPLEPDRASALGELPWAFRGGDECAFIGEGSVANRSPEILVLPADGCAPDRGVAMMHSPARLESESNVNEEPVRVENRTLWRVSERSEIQTEFGCCVIRPATGHAGAEEYRNWGKRYYELESRWPLFLEPPRLSVAKTEQEPRTVPGDEISWRQGSGEWVQNPNGFGLWDLRHTRAGELKHMSRVGILPKRFSLEINPGADLVSGELVLKHAGNIRVGTRSGRVACQAKGEVDVLSLRLTATDRSEIPQRAQLGLHWGTGRELLVSAPFPGQGARFVPHELARAEILSVSDVHRMRATALSPDRHEKFWIEGELKAEDADKVHRVAHFRRDMRQDRVSHELPLFELRSMIELLLSASSSGAAQVELRILDRTQRVHAKLRVGRFAAELEFNPNLDFFSVSPALDTSGTVAIEALPLARPGDEPTNIAAMNTGDSSLLANLPREMHNGEPWLFVMRHGDQVRTRPLHFAGMARQQNSQVRDGPESAEISLANALADSDLNTRTIRLGVALDAMTERDASSNTESEWAFLAESLIQTQDIPVGGVDLLAALATRPRLLVRCLFRLEKGLREKLWYLDNTLPFSWLLIKRNIWQQEALRAFVKLQEQLSGHVSQHAEIAQNHVISIMQEGAERFQALQTVAIDSEFTFAGAGISDNLVGAVTEQRNMQVPEQIRIWVNRDDWPKGYGRSEWSSKLGEVPETLWLKEETQPERQPLFDTPVAAACCCFFAQPDTSDILHIKRIRAHDPDWFDCAYIATWFQLAAIADHVRTQH